ncbi:MAG: iron-containing alcohol dehydrogenase [Candidatus Bathyarchaeota archaeon]|nr:iron-containing alcohol dehydrogenase [Candidatus Bathyarchaeota archaeon]
MNGITYNFPASIIFGWGEAEKIADHVKAIEALKPLIVTDEGLEKTGILRQVREHLEQKGSGYAVFKDVHPNPTEADVVNGLKVYREEGCDSVIALGGGSPMDAAKAILTMVNHQGELKQYYVGAPGRLMITGEIPPFIAIPTTSGTGSETSRGAIITDSDNRKRSVSSPRLLPRIVLLDPSLTVGMPPKLTAYTGLDALSHNLEAFAVDIYAPICDAFAREGMRLVAKSLLKAYAEGGDREARSDMMMASTMGSLAFMKGLGVVHSLAHQLSSQRGIPHGAACGIMMPHAVRYNLSEQKTWQRYKEVAGILGGEDAEEVPALLEKLLAALGVEPKLGKWGVTEEDIQVMSRYAMLDHCHPRNPRACTEGSMADLYRAAL